MSENRELPRISSGGSDCSDDLCEVFRSAKQDDPEAAQVDRLWQALQPVVGGPTGGGDGGSSTGDGPAGPVAAVAGTSAATLARYTLVGAGVTSLIIATATMWNPRTESSMQPATTTVLSAEPPAPPVSAPAPAAEEPELHDAGTQRKPAPRVVAKPAPTADAEVAPSMSEAQFLGQAHTELRQGNAARALSMTAEHRRLYPRAALSQECDLIAVEALVALGRRDEAMARSRAFLDRYPHSAHARRLRTVLGVSDENGDEKKDPDNVIINDAGAHSPHERLETGDAGR